MTKDIKVPKLINYVGSTSIGPIKVTKEEAKEVLDRNYKLVELMKKIGVVDEKVLQEKLKKAYYEGEPIITDEQYDELFGDKDYVGYTVEQNGPWEVLEHKIAMGSLNKIKTWKDAQKFVDAHKKVVWEPKLDGLSIELVYEFGKLTHAILRGGGDKGEDILKNAINFQYVPQEIPITVSYVSIRGEVVISQSSFNQLRQTSGADYSNRRNCVPGICRRYDGKYSDFLSFWAYDIYEETDWEIKFYSSELEKLTTLYNYGFKVPFAYNVMSEEQYNDYGKMRDTAEEFQMDGLVIKSLDMSEQIALKFDPNGEETVVTEYTWEVGSTGKLVPIVHFETVNVGGTNLTKASVGSYRAYIELNAPIGSKVKVRKMNDVIPKVTEVIQKSSNTLNIPAICPICKSHLERQGADLYCVNKKCPVKLEGKCTAVYWAASIKGVTDKWVKELIKLGKIQKPSDVLRVTPEDIASIDGYSLNKGNQIMSHLTQAFSESFKSNNVTLILQSLSIPTIGGKALDKLIGYVGNFATLEDMTIDAYLEKAKTDLLQILGNSKGTKVFEYFKENKEEIKDLIETIRNISIEEG